MDRHRAADRLIILVVLLAIAGAVAAVILTRAGTETDRLEQETDRWTGITNKTGCEIADGAWNNVGGTCGEPGTAIHNVNDAHTTPSCVATVKAAHLQIYDHPVGVPWGRR